MRRNTVMYGLGLSCAALALIGPARADQVIADDLIVQSSLCVGLDCVNGETFSFDTIRLKENNLRIGFSDTSSVGGFPSNDWEIRINDSANGGNNYFAIVDVTAGQTLFQLCAVADPGCTNIVPSTVDPQTAINTAAIATNAGNIATNAAGIATNAAGIATNTGAIATNTGNIATNTGNIATNTGNIATNTAYIATLQGTVTGQGTQIGTLQTTVAGHTGQIGTLQGTVATHSGQIGTLQGTVATHTGQIGTLQTTVATHTGQIGTLQTTVAGHGTRIGGLETVTARHTTQIGGLQRIATDHEDRIGSLEGTTSALGGRVSGLENRVNAFSNDLRAVKSGVAVAIAMGGGVALDSDQDGAIEVNLGSFDGETALGVVGAVRLDTNLTLNLGVGSGLSSNSTGGRVGFQYSW